MRIPKRHELVRCRSGIRRVTSGVMPLLEREKALADLHVALAARRGQGCVALVSGDAGLGKTSVVRAFLAGLDAESSSRWMPSNMPIVTTHGPKREEPRRGRATARRRGWPTFPRDGDHAAVLDLGDVADRAVGAFGLPAGPRAARGSQPPSPRLIRTIALLRDVRHSVTE